SVALFGATVADSLSLTLSSFQRTDASSQRRTAFLPRLQPGCQAPAGSCGRREKLASRQRPTHPHTNACSTIGAEGLNCRVRNGNGCFPLARTTGKAET